MNSSLLQNDPIEQFEDNSLFTNLFLSHNNKPLFENEYNNNNDSLLFLSNESFNEDNSLYKEKLLTFEQQDFLGKKHKDNLSVFESKNYEFDKKYDTLEQFKTVSNMIDNASCINYSPISLLTTSNSNMINNVGVKKDEPIFESQKDTINFNINNQNENLTDGVFKCDFLENIALGLDDPDDSNFYYNNKKNNRIKSLVYE